MSKTVLLLVLAVVAAIQVSASPLNNDAIARAAGEGNWDLVHKLFAEGINNGAPWKPEESESSIRNLVPKPGQHVYGEAQSYFHSSSNVNGEKSERSGGHKIINNDGKISEFDFNPEV